MSRRILHKITGREEPRIVTTVRVVPTLPVVFATLRLAGAHPLAWLAGAALLALQPLLASAAPLAITARRGGDPGLIQDIAFMAAVVGAMGGTSALQRLSPAIAHASPGPDLKRDLAAVGAVILVCALLAMSPALGPALATGAALRMAAGFTALAALGCLLLRLKLPLGSAPWILGATAALAPLELPHPLSARTLAALSAALVCANWLLDHPPGRTA
jgi:hypothetical protein